MKNETWSLVELEEKPVIRYSDELESMPMNQKIQEERRDRKMMNKSAVEKWRCTNKEIGKTRRVPTALEIVQRWRNASWRAPFLPARCDASTDLWFFKSTAFTHLALITNYFCCCCYCCCCFCCFCVNLKRLLINAAELVPLPSNLMREKQPSMRNEHGENRVEMSLSDFDWVDDNRNNGWTKKKKEYNTLSTLCHNSIKEKTCFSLSLLFFSVSAFLCF